MAGRKISPSELRKAQQLVEDGATYAEASRITGISTDTLSRRLKGVKRPSKPSGSDAPGAADSPIQAPEETPPVEPRRRRPDPTPGSRNRRRAPDSDKPRPRGRIPELPSDAELERMVAKIAKAPAVPMATVFHCTYCARHFITAGDPLAVELVEMSKDDRDLRDILEWLYSNWRRYAWAGMLVSYVGVPLAHHALPSGMYSLVAPLAGMPPRNASSHEQAHAAPAGTAPPPPPQAATAPPPPPPQAAEPDFSNPFVGLDTDALLATARSFGIEADSIEELMSAATEIFSADAAAPPAGPPPPGSSIVWPTLTPDARTAAEIRAATNSTAPAPAAPPHTDTGE